MCEKCFENEINQFNSAQVFQSFETALEEKLKQPDGLFFLRQSSAAELTQYSIYSCRACEAKWYFQVPDTLNPGFFLLEAHAQQRITKATATDDRWRKILITICIMIMIICLFVLAGI